MREGLATLGFAREQHARDVDAWKAACLKFVRTCLEVPAAPPTAYCKSVHARARTAFGAWTVAEVTHPDDDAPPVGVPVFWKGGSKKFGHVALSAGGGLVWSNDVKRTGFIDLVALDSVHQNWHQTYVGWAEDLNGQRIYEPPLPLMTVAPLVKKLTGLPEGHSGLPAGHLDGPNEGHRLSWHDRGPAWMPTGSSTGCARAAMTATWSTG